jgi:hypothetical protein
VLPTLYQGWIADLLPAGLSDESRATCATCAMLPGPDGPTPDQAFHPDVKCCTYQPELTNFRAGMILADDGTAPSAREVLERRVADRVGVTPLGVAAHPLYTTIYAKSVAGGSPHAFGRAPSLRCPYYQEADGSCGVWRNREATCSTWFCRFERGVPGRRLWELVKMMLSEVDRQLATWCVSDLLATDELEHTLLGAGLPRRLDEHALNNTCDPGAYRKVWGAWEGRELELFAECARRVAALDWAAAVDHAGARAKALAGLVVAARAALDDRSLPAQAHRGKGLLRLGRKRMTATAHNPLVPHDSVELPARVLDAAPRLIAAPLAEARRQLAAAGIELDDDLLTTLFDYEILAR